MTTPIRVLLVEGDADDVKRARLLLSEAPGPGFHITAISPLVDAIDELVWRLTPSGRARRTTS